MWVFKGEGWGVTTLELGGDSLFLSQPTRLDPLTPPERGRSLHEHKPFLFFSPTLFINELNLIERMPVEQAQLLVQCWRGIARDERAFSM